LQNVEVELKHILRTDHSAVRSQHCDTAFFTYSYCNVSTLWDHPGYAIPWIGFWRKNTKQTIMRKDENKHPIF
jgi:hypothetical protein